MKVLFLLLLSLLPSVLNAQGQTPRQVYFVTNAPSGSCSSSYLAWQYVRSSRDIYACGTDLIWHVINSASGTSGGGNFSATGSAGASSIAKTHNANTNNVDATCRDASGNIIFGRLDNYTSANTTTVYFDTTLAATTTCVFVTGAGTGSNVANNTILGNISGASATPIGLTAAQVWSVLGVTPAANFPALTGDAATSAGSLAVIVSKINGTAFSGTNGNLVGFGASNIPVDTGIVAANVALLNANNIFTANGALSTGAGPGAKFNGTWITGGSATTTKPYFLLEPNGTTTTNWSTNGTGFGLNAPSGFTGNLLDIQINAARILNLSSTTLQLASGVSILSGQNISVPSGGVGLYSGAVAIGTTSTLLFTSSTVYTGGVGVALSRVSGNILGVGNNTPGDVSGQIAATKMLAAGVAPTLGGACTTAASGTLTDESGKITTTTTGSCTFTITFGTAYTTDPPSCSIHNNTTANIFVPSTTVTVLTGVGTTVSGDVISYSCRGHKP